MNNYIKELVEMIKKLFPMFSLKNVFANILYFISMVALFSLITRPFIKFTLIFLLIALFFTAGIVKSAWKIHKSKGRLLLFVTFLLSLPICFDLYTFSYRPMINLPFVKKIAGFFPSGENLLVPFGIFICAISLFALSLLLILLILGAEKYLFNNEKYGFDKKNNFLKNVKGNFLFFISGAVFAISNVRLALASLVFSICALLFFSGYKEKIIKSVYVSKLFSAISIISAIGISISIVTWRFQNYTSQRIAKIEHILTIGDVNLFKIAVVIFTLLTLPFIYVWVSLIFNELRKIFSVHSFKNSLGKFHWVFLGVILIIGIVAVNVIFNNTCAFYSPDNKTGFDAVYTSDSKSILNDRAYTSVTSERNLLHQPLFAVFAAPFMGIPYFISYVVNSSEIFSIILLTSFQVGVLLFCFYLLSLTIDTSRTKRFLFILLGCCLYSTLLYSLLIEQYIFVFFYLTMCIYLIKKEEVPAVAILGATGSVITSFVLLPFAKKTKSLNKIIHYSLETIVLYILLLALFCKFNIFGRAPETLSFIRSFTGEKVSFLDKVYQNTIFIRNYFITPKTTIIENNWQLEVAESISITGGVILLLSLLSLYLNRRKFAAKAAGLWMLFAFIMMFVLGYGTRENGLILYSLYFGWPFLVLLFLLLEYIEEKTKLKFILPIMTILAMIVLLYINIPGMGDLIEFGIKYYPVK